MIADALGRVIAFRIAPGQAHELPDAIPLLDSLSDVPNWVVADRGRVARAADPAALSEPELEELKRLRKENAELRTDREILRKAAAYFARETMR